MDGALTPETVRDVRFSRARHGYRVEEVDAFLSSVAEGVEALEAEAAALRSRVAELEDELPASQARRVLVSATSVAETLLAEANREADAVVTEARRLATETANALVRATEAYDAALTRADDLRSQLEAARAAVAPFAGGSGTLAAQLPFPGLTVVPGEARSAG